jgi:hypothetical protein
MSKKMALIGVVILLFLAGVYFLARQNNKVEEKQKNMETEKNYKQTQEESKVEIDPSDWQTYKDSKYGLEFEFNPKWEIRDEGPVAAIGGETLFVIVDKNRNDIAMSITRFKTSEDPDEWIKEKGWGIVDRQYTINNYPTYYSKTDNPKVYLLHQFLISHNNKLVSYSFTEKYRNFNSKTEEYEETTFSQYLPDFEAMVDSIKFID